VLHSNAGDGRDYFCVGMDCEMQARLADVFSSRGRCVDLQRMALSMHGSYVFELLPVCLLACCPRRRAR